MQGPKASWEQQIVGCLTGHRRLGRSFDVAWALAIRTYPYKARGVMAPTRLFEEDGQRAEPFPDFFRRACENAYEDRIGEVGSGNGPARR